MKLVLASKNEHKLRELRNILGEYGLEVALQSEYGLDLDVEETGTTFEENSFLKAQAVMEASGMPAIADDSGVMVDALGGEPGVYSARYGGRQTDLDRTMYLLENMKDVPAEKRTAQFVSVITCVFPDGRKIVARGECPGTILFELRGNGGFGYDPVFYVEQLGKTYAELTDEEKNSVSHRARALEEFSRKYREGIYDDK